MQDRRGLVYSAKQLLGARESAIGQSLGLNGAGIRSMSIKDVALASACTASKKLPPGIAAPPGLSQPCQEDVKAVKADMSSIEMHDYKVLLQNLPKKMMKEAALREMIRQAELKDVTKLAFRSDGRVLITVASYAAVCQCITHFNGLPWFHAPTCAVPVVSATQVHVRKVESSPAAQMSSSMASFAEAPAFVPGTTHWKASTQSPEVAKKLVELDGFSEKSTEGGVSDDEAMCGSDSEPEAQLVSAC
jgi:hypothetical protein